MLSISIADNVISYKNQVGCSKNQNRWFRYIKVAKKTITQSRFAQIFYRYDIFWMVPGESSCLGGSEYVWQRGVFMAELRAADRGERYIETIAPLFTSSGRSWPSFKKNRQHHGVKKKRISQNLRKWACHSLWEEVICVARLTFEKFWEINFFVTPHIFANGPHLVALTRHRATKTRSRNFCTALSYRYSESRVRKDSVGTCPKKF